MAKPQFILATHNRYVEDEKINSGFHEYDPKKFYKEVQRYLAIRQRDFLDGEGYSGLKRIVEAHGLTYKGEAYFDTKLSQLLSHDTDEVIPSVVDGVSVWYVTNLNTLVRFNVMEAERFTTSSLTDLAIGMEDLLDTQIIGYSKTTLKEIVDGSTEYRQLLPYTVFKVRGENKFFAYRRTSKVGETRLAGNSSVGWGGHIDLCDVVFDRDTSVIDIEKTIFDGSQRELGEELKITKELEDLVVNDGLTPILFGIINDTSNHVGRLHLGLVNIYEVDENDILGVNEDELEYLGVKTPEEILADNPESWTRLIMEKFI